MFLHLGNDMSIRLKDVVSIHDYGVFQSGDNKVFLESVAREGRLLCSTEEGQQEKSLVVTKDRVYVSAISSGTLKRRAGFADLRNE